MHHIITLAVVHLLHLPAGSGPVLPLVPVVVQQHSLAPPDSTSAVERAVVAYTAYLTDLLSLTPTQQRQLAQPTRTQLQQLYAIQMAPTSRLEAEAAASVVAARYHRQLARVLTTSQYGNLVIFGGALEALPHHRSLRQVNAYWTRKALVPAPARYAAAEYR